MIGHSMPASGMAGLIKTAMALHDAVLPPSLHLEEPHPALTEGRLRPLRELAGWESSRPRLAAVNAFGFGGSNAHLVLEEAPGRSRRRAPRKAKAGGTPVLRLAAGSVEELSALLAVPDEELLARAGTDLDYLDCLGEGGEAAEGGCRIAVADPTPRRLELARTVVGRGTPWRGRSDVWFTAEPLLAKQDARVAFLFPGFEPVFEPKVDDIAEHFGLERPGLTGRSDLVGHAADVIAVGRTLAAALRSLGIRPDIAAGHSLGEWTAMVVAGMYAPDAVDDYLDALDQMTLDIPDVAYAALGCGAERAASVILDVEGVVVSHDNCPHQSVICGPPERVREALDRLWAEGVLGQELPFRSGFHTPMAEAYLGPVHESFERLPIREPQTELWSATTIAPFPPEPEKVRALIVRHLLEPVRFSGLVWALYQAGVRAFVQVGPGSLTGFVGDALGPADVTSMAVNVPRRGGMEQLARVVAALWVEGYVAAPAPVTEPEPAGPVVELALGQPTVRLSGVVPPLVPPQPKPTHRPPRSRPAAPVMTESPRAELAPVMAEFEALLDDATETSRAVLDALRPARTELETRQTFSLETMPYLRDHCLIPQRDGWTEHSDRFPVVPFTTLLQLMADVAARLCPGKVVAGLEDVRALRWVVAEPATTATVRARRQAADRVRVVIEGHTECTVLFADGYPAPPAPDRTPLTGEGPPHVTADRFYAERWMFHGPRYQGVTEITGLASDGARAVLRSLSAPGALMDSAGQICGHWFQVHAEEHQTVFPVGIDRVRWYGPLPVEGTRVDLTVWKRTATRFDAELVLADGRVWCRIEGWTTHRFFTDGPVWRMKFTPELSGIGEPQPGGWVLVRRRWDTGSARDLLMRQYLGAAERADFDRLPPRAQDSWLLGRIAAKDAVRHWLWDRGSGPIFPAELTVGEDDWGMPCVTGPFDAPMSVTIAHTDELGAAVVSSGPEPSGVDFEVVGADRLLVCAGTSVRTVTSSDVDGHVVTCTEGEA
jgi:hypothetical protein